MASKNSLNRRPGHADTRAFATGRVWPAQAFRLADPARAEVSGPDVPVNIAGRQALAEGADTMVANSGPPGGGPVVAPQVPQAPVDGAGPGLPVTPATQVGTPGPKETEVSGRPVGALKGDIPDQDATLEDPVVAHVAAEKNTVDPAEVGRPVRLGRVGAPRLDGNTMVGEDPAT